MVFCVQAVLGQKYDPRLVQNHGDTISTIYQNNHNYYNFLLFELDYSYELKPGSDMSQEQLSAAIPAGKISNSAGKILRKEDVVKGEFNFKQWGIVLKKDTPVIIQLDNETYLCFYDKVSNNIRFAKSPLYTK